MDHLGRFEAKGFGLLKIEIESENDVVKSAAQKFPDYFDRNENFTENIFYRLYYSAKLTAYYKNLGKFAFEDTPLALILRIIIRGLALAIRRLLTSN